tara:strand:+ start:3691 stop:5430 length:1740 start_codon:yes stop_codon:yes gene_type:complete
MKILKQLSKFFIILFLSSIFFKSAISNEPVDIWNIEKNESLIKKKLIENSEDINNENSQGIKILDQSNNIIVNNSLSSNNIKLAGLYDPAENGLSIDMWSNSNGEDIKFFLEKLSTKKLSNFSDKILDVALLTNSYLPSNNITREEFLDFKFQYLIKKKDFNLIRNFLIKNPSLKNNDKIIRFYTDYYLSNSQLDKSCEIFDHVKELESDYLNNFKIYCLIDQNKKEEAQLLIDLKSEFGSINEFFLKKFSILMGYEKKDELISDENILKFHLSHKTNENFSYEPKIETSNYLWMYLSSSNLLKDTQLINIENSDQVKLIEKATNEGAYKEQDLFNLYKRFQFDINQLVNFNSAYKLLPDYEGRALIYQRLLLTSDSILKINLSSILNKSFNDSSLPNVFDEELSKILKTINEDQVPSNFTQFYEQNKESEKEKELKIKFNNKIFHQSKILNYFLNKTSLPKVEKEANDLLKKIKKNKKYSFSKKDIIMIESLKSDGVQILKKYDKLYESKPNLPVEINSMIVNGETGLVLLKIADTIGEDSLENIDLESVSFIVGILNELKTINLRNEIILKVLPLKV